MAGHDDYYYNDEEHNRYDEDHYFQINENVNNDF